MTLDVGNYWIDIATGEKYSIFHDPHHLLTPKTTHLAVNYSAPLAEFGGKNANDLISSRRLERHNYHMPYPLKFSFNELARYEDLPRSATDPTKGCPPDLTPPSSPSELPDPPPGKPHPALPQIA